MLEGNKRNKVFLNIVILKVLRYNTLSEKFEKMKSKRRCSNERE